MDDISYKAKIAKNILEHEIRPKLMEIAQIALGLIGNDAIIALLHSANALIEEAKTYVQKIDEYSLKYKTASKPSKVAIIELVDSDTRKLKIIENKIIDILKKVKTADKTAKEKKALEKQKKGAVAVNKKGRLERKAPLDATKVIARNVSGKKSIKRRISATQKKGRSKGRSKGRAPIFQPGSALVQPGSSHSRLLTGLQPGIDRNRIVKFQKNMELLQHTNSYYDRICKVDPPGTNLKQEIDANLQAITYVDTVLDYRLLTNIACHTRSLLLRYKDELKSLSGYPGSASISIEKPDLTLVLSPNNPTKPLSDSSVEGVTWLVGIVDGSSPKTNYAVLKYSKVNAIEDHNLLHEIAIGKYLNMMFRELTPNFMFLYGGFICTPPLESSGHNYNQLCNRPGEPMDFILLAEVVTSPVTFHEFCKTHTNVADIASVIQQIIFSLWIAQERAKFVHSDLHAYNVLVQALPIPVTLTYQLPRSREADGRLGFDTVTINARYLAKIIDYGMSVVTWNSERILPISDLPPLNLSNPTWFVGHDFSVRNGIFFPLFDVCRLLEGKQFIWNALQMGGYVDFTRYLHKDDKRLLSFGGGLYWNFSNICQRCATFRKLTDFSPDKNLTNALLEYGFDNESEKDSLKFLINCFL